MGTLMIGMPCNAHEALGFRDELNFFHCPPGELVGMLERLMKTPERMQQVASNGQKLIAAKHSFAARQTQIIECLTAIRDRTFLGSYWSDGEFCITTNGPPCCSSSFLGEQANPHSQ